MAGQTDVKIRLALDGAGQVQAGVQGVGQALGATAEQALKLESASAQLAVAQARVDATAKKAAEAQAAFAKAAADSKTSVEQLARLQQQAAAATANQQLASAKAAEAVQALQLLQAAHIGVTQATKLTGNQTAQLSAQLQDLFVQIQAGGSPMTALIQQGSQLSAVFGGTGNALRAVVSLISPVVAAGGALAAVVAAGAVAYRQNSKEQEAFRLGLVLTGNAAGATVGQLNDMAKAQAAVVGSQSKAAEVLAALASTGNVSRAQLAAATDAAIQLERVGGPAVESTIKKFSELGKSPLDALTKLNEAERFLTKEIVDQVAALEAQGRQAEAAAVAQEAYANTTIQRSQQLASNLGLLERAWQGVGDKAKAAWNAILNIGRTEGAGTQLQAVQAQIAAAEAAMAQAQNARPGTMLGGQAALEVQRQQRILDGLRAQAASLEEIVRLEQRSATQQAERAQAGQIAARWAAEEVKLLSPKKQLELELQRIEREGLQIGARREEIDARRAKAIADAAKKAGTGKTDEQRRLEQEAEALEKAVGLSGSYYKQLAVLNQARQDGKLIGEAYVKAVTDLTAAQPFAVKSAKEEADAIKQVADAMTRGAQVHAAYINELDRSADAAAAQVLSLQDEERAAAMAAQKNISLAQAIQQVVIARLEEKRANSSNDPEALAVIDREIAKRRELVGLIASKEARDASKRSAEEMARDWQRVSDQVGQSLSDALMQGGKSARDYLEGLFRQLVLRPLLQPLVQPIAALIAGATGSAAQAAGLDGASSITSLFSGISNATKLPGALGFLASGAGGSIAAGSALGFGNTFALGSQLATSGGTLAGFSTAGQLAGAGQFGAAGGMALGTLAPWALGLGAGALGGRALSNGYAISGSGNSLTNVGTIAGAVLGGPLGSAIGGLIGGAVNRLFGRRAPETESTELVGSFNGGDFTGNLQDNILEKGGVFRSDKRYSQSRELSSDLEKALDESGRQLAELSKKYGEALGLPGDELSKVTTEFKVKFTDDADANAKAVAEALQKYSDALFNAYAPDLEPLRRSGESISQVIERVGSNLLGVNAVLKQLDLGLLATSVAGGKAATELQELFGGVDALNQSAAGYYQAYYSEAERAQKATVQLTDALGTVGLSVPATKQAYRQLVEAQDLNTESGRRAFQVLLSMAGAFDAISQSGQKAADELAEKASKRAVEVAQERAGLEEKLLQLQGKTLELRRREREALDASNRSLSDSINALEDLASMVGKLRGAAETAMAAVERAVSAQQQALQKAYDSQIKVIDAQAKAINAAFDATAKEVAAQRDAAQNAYTQQAASIRGQLNTLEANEKARAAEYRSAVDAVAAERKAAQTAYAQASTKLQDTIRAATDTVGRLRGLNDSLKSTISALRPIGSEASDRARAQAQIREALAVAQAGGALPDAEGLRDALAAISKPSEDLFASFQDYARDFFRTSVDLRDLQKISGSQLNEAQAQLDATISLKDALDAANEANLQRLDSIREALDVANEQARAAYDLQRESLQAQLDAARGTLDSTLAGLDDRLKSAQEARDQSIGQLDGQKEALKVQLEADLSALDDILTEARRQYEATMGVNTSVLSVRDAVLQLNAALLPLSAATGTPPPTPTGSSTAPVTGQWVTSGQVQTWTDAAGAVAVQPVGNTNPTNTVIKANDGQVFNAQQAMDYISANIGNASALKAASSVTGIGAASVDALMGWTAGTFAALTEGGSIKGFSVADIRGFVTQLLEAGDLPGIHARAVKEGITSRTLDAVMGWEQGTALKEALRLGLPAFASGGLHTGGVRLVGENGPELAVTGPERIYSFDQLMQMAGGAGRDEALVDEVKALRRELAELRAAGQVTAANTGKTARTLERWDQDGMPEERTL